MQNQTIRQKSLVLYKGHAALVVNCGEKLELELEGGKRRKVRPKDIKLLHPGPLTCLTDLKPLAGDVETAWELLAGDSATIAELAELIYDEYTPSAAWAAWQLVVEELYFRGTPECIEARSPADVARTQSMRKAKAAKQQAWTAFVDRVRWEKGGLRLSCILLFLSAKNVLWSTIGWGRGASAGRQSGEWSFHF